MNAWSLSTDCDCFAEEHTFLVCRGVPNLEYERECAFSLQTGDIVKAATGQTARLIRKTPRENRAVLEISVDDSKMRVTPSHRVLAPEDGGNEERNARGLQVGDFSNQICMHM